MGWRHKDQAAEVLRTAEETLLRAGPEAALRYLGRSEYAGSEAVRQRMHALVWIHASSLPGSLLAEPFLDAVWSQCDVCAQTWVIPPLAADQSVMLDARSQVGGQCPECGRVICAGCARLTETRCVCLAGTLLPLRRPTGRTPCEPGATSVQLQPQAPSSLPSDLYYRRSAWPIAMDPRFPHLASASSDAHLRWAEILTDRGMYVQAEQQLDLAPEPLAPAARARAYWLRARLELVRLDNCAHLPMGDPLRFALGAETTASRVLRLLDDAVAADPGAGDIWLAAAGANLHPFGPDPMRAVECARQARALLGETPAALVGLGRALIAAGRADEAFAAVRLLPAGADDAAATGDLPGPDPGVRDWAELLAPCGREPVDPDALLRLGRRYLREGDTRSATTIFTWLTEHCPDHPAGYAGLAGLRLHRCLGLTARLARAHELCLLALERDENFGFARETLGLIYSWGKSELAAAGLERAIRSSISARRQPRTRPVTSRCAAWRRVSSTAADWPRQPSCWSWPKPKAPPMP